MMENAWILGGETLSIYLLQRPDTESANKYKKIRKFRDLFFWSHGPYHSMAFLFFQNSPLAPFMSAIASITGVSAP
jgi:hypothetical protein